MSQWGETVRKYGPRAYGIAWRILGQAEDVEDVVQELFLECYQRADEKQIRNWEAFICRLATFRALDKLRKRKHECSLDVVPVVDRQPGPEAEAIAKEAEHRLRVAVAQLPERQSAVFCLRCFEQLSPTEIATLLDVSPNAVSIALHKAREQIRMKWLRHEPQDLNESIRRTP